MVIGTANVKCFTNTISVIEIPSRVFYYRYFTYSGPCAQTIESILFFFPGPCFTYILFDPIPPCPRPAREMLSHDTKELDVIARAVSSPSRLRCEARPSCLVERLHDHDGYSGVLFVG